MGGQDLTVEIRRRRQTCVCLTFTPLELGRSYLFICYNEDSSEVKDKALDALTTSAENVRLYYARSADWSQYRKLAIKNSKLIIVPSLTPAQAKTALKLAKTRLTALEEEIEFLSEIASKK